MANGQKEGEMIKDRIIACGCVVLLGTTVIAPAIAELYKTSKSKERVSQICEHYAKINEPYSVLDAKEKVELITDLGRVSSAKFPKDVSEETTYLPTKIRLDEYTGFSKRNDIKKYSYEDPCVILQISAEDAKRLTQGIELKLLGVD